MLEDCEVIAFTQTTQPERAKAFYGEVLGLKFQEESIFALVFSAGGTMLRVQKVRELSPLPFTALGWRVPDIYAALQELSKRGVAFERFKGMPQDDAGVWTTPDGGKVCWFKDTGWQRPIANPVSFLSVRSNATSDRDLGWGDERSDCEPSRDVDRSACELHH